MTQKKTREPLSASAVQHIRGELRRLEATGKTMIKSGRMYVCCPFHHEKTPSCMVTIRADSKYQMGTFKCMGCGESGGWNKLAEAMNLQPLGQDAAVFKQVQRYDADFYRRKVLDERFNTFSGLLEEMGLRKPNDIPEDMVWRTIPAKLLRKVRACRVTGVDRRPYLFLPTYVNEELVGGVRAVMEDTGDKTIVKYKNSDGEWSKQKGLYPYDTTSELLDKFEKKHGFRGLVIVEGARDALCWLCEGMPALGLLGTQSWTEVKRDYVLDLDPDFVLVCLDGDTAGRKSEEKVWADLKGLVPTRKMNLTRFNSECGFDVDPGNAPEWVIKEVVRTLHRRKGQK
jgi:hypothetical protein